MSAYRECEEGCVNRLGALIAPFSKGLGLEEAVRLERIRKEWAGLVGSPLSVHISPVGLKNGELLINADSPVWLQQVTFYKSEIIRKLSLFNIKDVRFRLGRTAPKEMSEKKLPEQPRIKPLSSEEKNYIEDAVSAIRDPELRRCIKKTVEKSMQIQPFSRKRE